MTVPPKLRVFVSSVQKELEHERAAVAQLISFDPFLLKHCEAVLYDKEPPAGRPNPKAYLDCLRSCQIYLLMFDVEYGRPAGDLSATHEEYRLAQETKLPTLVSSVVWTATTASTPQPLPSRTVTSSSPSPARTVITTASRHPKAPPASSRRPSKPS